MTERPACPRKSQVSKIKRQKYSLVGRCHVQPCETIPFGVASQHWRSLFCGPLVESPGSRDQHQEQHHQHDASDDEQPALAVARPAL